MPNNVNTSRIPGEYSDEYRMMAFSIWYERGKPGHMVLYNILKEQDKIRDSYSGLTVTPTTIENWVSGGWAQKAIQLDQQVITRIDEQMVNDKLIMLERHANLGQEMQKIGIEFLREKGVDRPRDAIMLLVHGVEIEREAKSVPRFLAEISAKSDEELINELKKLAEGQETPLLDLPSRDIDAEE